MRPVIVGVGEISNQDRGRIAHPVDLMEDAARLALEDAGIGAAGWAHIGAVYSTPLSVFTDDDGGAMVAERLGLPAGRRERSGYSGAGPQRLLAAAGRSIASGEIDAAIIVGGVAESSVRAARVAGLDAAAPPTSTWSQGSRGAPVPAARSASYTARFRAQPPSAEGGAGVQAPVTIFALIESALAAVGGRDPETHRASLGELLAPFTEVAASRPGLAWSPVVRSASDIATASTTNRFIAEPYTKLMCSFPTVDLAAAVIVMSEALADRLGVASARRVHVWDVTAASEAGPPSVRADLHRSVALHATVARTMAGAGLTTDDLARFDLYSCFPAAVQLTLDAFGLDPGDPRPFTLTGGLPYFGGPGASYSLHGMAAMVEQARSDAGSVGAVVGIGGSCHDFSLGVYSSAEPPRPAVFAELDDVRRELEREMTPIVTSADGAAVVDAMTVVHERDEGPVEVPLIARLADGSRVGARAADPRLATDLSGTSLVGRAVQLRMVDGQCVFQPG